MTPSKLLLLALLGACCVVDTMAQENCMCGWFVDTMWGKLSTIPPLDSLPGATVGNRCGLQQCETHCAAQGQAVQTVNLNEMIGGKPRGQIYCETIHDLIKTDVDNEPLIVLSRVPFCENFIVWGTTPVYTSSTHLCCFGPNYYACR